MPVKYAFLALLTLIACSEPSEDPPTGDVFIRNGDVTIAGTLDTPSTPGPWPVMIFVPGSGTSTRADDREALDIALPRGVAVFRYDKRGLGQSTGTFEEVSAANSDRVLGLRASDVSAIVDYLAGRPDIRASQIFLWGASQGGWVAPLVAAANTKVAFIICVSGGGSPVGTSDYYDELTDDPAVTVEAATAQLDGFAGPFGYDPRPTLAALRTPALFVFGGLDRSNPSLFDKREIEAIQTAHPVDFTVHFYPRMDHDLVDADTGTFPADLFPNLFVWAQSKLGPG